MSGNAKAQFAHARRVSISGARFLAIVLLGPLVGAVVYVLAVLVLEPAFRADPETVTFAIFLLFMGWVIGLVPALLGAIVWSLLPHPRSRGQRAALALMVGAIAACAGLVVSAPFFGFQFEDPAIFALFALSGAIALAATALPWSHP